MPHLYGPGFPEEYEPETQLTSYIIGPGVILEDVNLKDANLSGANLEGVNLTTVDLSGVKSGDIADGPTLSDEYKIISGYIVGPKVDLSGADLSDVNLTGMDLSEVNLSNADLSGATLTNVASRGIEGTPSTLPEGYQISGGFILGPDVNLSDKTLYNLNLSEVDLSA